MVELVIIWETGEKEIHPFNCEELAERIGNGYKMAFGNQIQWIGIRKKVGA